jgi:chloride channel protein, CIC family
MTQNIISVRPQETLFDTLHKMTTNDVAALPVVDSDGKLLGIISRRDIFRAYDKFVSGFKSPDGK